MTNKQMEPDAHPRLERRQRKRQANRSKKIGAFAVVVAIAIVAAVAIVQNLGAGGKEGTTPAAEPPTATPVDARAKEVATGFVEAFGASDADRAITYLADDANIAGLNGVEGSAELRLLLSLLEAQGYKQKRTSCEETGSSVSGTSIRCTFDFHAIRSDEIGRGPYGGSYFDLTVRDGEIVRASVYWETEKFSPQMWEPFATWVSKTYPEDGAVMYNSAYSDFLLSKESVRLWERHSREYAKEVGRRTEGQ